MERAARERRTFRRMFSFVFFAISAMTLMTAGMATSAHAATPGENGRIAFRVYFDEAHTRGAIFTIHPDGTGLVQVTHRGKVLLDTEPDWSPDGRWMVFMRQAGLVCSCKPARIFKVRPDGTDLTRLSHHPCKPGNCVEDLYPSWSPKGKRIVFTRFDDDAGLVALYVMRADGTHERQVAGTAALGGSAARFSPDGKSLVFNGGDDRGAAVFTIRLDGTHLRRLSPWKLHAGGGPDWSPDGRWIVLESHQEQDRQDNLYLVHPNGDDLHKITTSPAHVHQWGSFSFSPDGTMITVSHNLGTGTNPDIYFMNLDGSGLRDVTTTPGIFESSPDWGPRQR
jgi:Tol biopolymer transport system component